MGLYSGLFLLETLALWYENKVLPTKNAACGTWTEQDTSSRIQQMWFYGTKPTSSMVSFRPKEQAVNWFLYHLWQSQGAIATEVTLFYFVMDELYTQNGVLFEGD